MSINNDFVHTINLEQSHVAGNFLLWWQRYKAVQGHGNKCIYDLHRPLRVLLVDTHYLRYEQQIFRRPPGRLVAGKEVANAGRISERRSKEAHSWQEPLTITVGVV